MTDEHEAVDIDHVAVRVSDLDESLRFYSGLLGMEVRDRDRYEEGETPYVAVVAGGRQLHLVPTDEEFDTEGEHVCLLLRSSSAETREEAENLVDELEDEGVEVEEDEPHRRYGAYGYDWAVYVRDPDDRRVELKLH